MSSLNATTSSDLSGGIIENTIRVFINEENQLNDKELYTIIDSWQFIVRKSAHFIIYFILGVLIYFGLEKFIYNKKRNILVSFIVCLLYATTDEVHQLFVSGRSGQVSDVALDSLGALLGIISICLMLRKLKKLKQKQIDKVMCL